jgi:Flp pilus assembly protein TadG
MSKQVNLWAVDQRPKAVVGFSCITAKERKPGLFSKGQSLIEFALLLPLLVLIIFGVLDLGRAFFSFIAITNAAREGARAYTMYPAATGYTMVEDIVKKEAGNQGLDPTKITVSVTCTGTFPSCTSEQPVRVTVSYPFELTMSGLFPQTILLRRYAEMMVP